MKIAFSNIACPDWLLTRVAEEGSRMGALGVELRAFAGDDRPDLASNPMLVEPDRLERLFDIAGITPMCLATGVRYDKPILPPVIGRALFDIEDGVKETKQFVDYADKAGIPFVRVFGYQLPGGEPLMWGKRRVAERLALAAQTARNTGVRLVIENGGSYARAEDLLELVERVDLQWLRVSYNTLTAAQAGDCPVEGIKLLRDHLSIVKVANTKDDEHSLLAEGDLPMHQVLPALADINYDGWIVYEYPKLWCEQLSDDPKSVLTHAIDTMYDWAKQSQSCGASCGCVAATI
jgi:sugar phosphate isomerase/epimerase